MQTGFLQKWIQRARGLAAGTAAITALSCASARLEAVEPVLQTLHSFSHFDSGPWAPASLIEVGNGIFYGTSAFGGVNDCGTLFRLSTTTGVLTNLFSFSGTDGWDVTGVTRGEDGNFYGSAWGGGNQGPDFVDGPGTLFRITTNGDMTLLFTFSGPDGRNPIGPLFRVGADFYGITLWGGDDNYGTVFRVTTNGDLTTLTSFHGTNGCNPGAGLVLGADNNLYGTTQYGGNGFSGAFTGDGTVFRLTTNGVLTTLNFFDGTNGSEPVCVLVSGGNGRLFGTTAYGGSAGYGTVFEITTNGALTTLFSFNGTNGRLPFASGLVIGNDGNLYGCTALGGTYNKGTVFRMTTNGSLTILAHINGTNGNRPQTSMIIGSDGNLYGPMADVDGQHPGNIFRLVQPPVLGITSSDANVLLAWNSFTNGRYRIERKSSLADAGWTPLSNFTASGNTATVVDPRESGQSFYRVVLLP